jgi:hypothetical protein
VRLSPLALALVLTSLPAVAAHAGGPPATDVVRHNVNVQLDVAKGWLALADSLELPESWRDREDLSFWLHENMEPEPSLKKVLREVERKGHLVRYAFTAKPDPLVLRYRGVIAHAPEQQPKEHQRSFSTTPGIVSKEGVYLARGSGWLPIFGEELLRVKLFVSGLPKGWSAVTEGASQAGPRFETHHNVDDAHLIAGPFTRYERKVGKVSVQAFLRSADEKLANQYLDVTKQYLEMYEPLLGDYPWEKFALVENFWETGYGMASFTLLGPKIIRFPFILHSSYPHELLHNWWGNSVYLHPDGGDWCEGLTAYLADHLVSEQRGRGAEHRQRTLARYADYVRGGEDFPLREFKGRVSAASEAVGYGKWMMVVHMLRQRLGDDAFTDGLRTFYKVNRYRYARFDDLRVAFEVESDETLESFFEHWIGREGAPRIGWSHTASSATREGRSLTVTLQQTQRAPSFPMDVPVVAVLEDGAVARGSARFRGGAVGELASATLKGLSAAPVRVHIDPDFDTFRQLAVGEVAPSLSRVLGGEKTFVVLPTLASKAEREAWRGFAAKICGGPPSASCVVVDDKAVDSLPRDASVWVLGYGNNLRAAAAVGAARHGASFDDAVLRVDGAEQLNAKHSTALAFAHPRNERLGLAFVGADRTSAIAGLARKLPHYGKYGYLGFAGDEPTNVLKGRWSPVASPMVLALSPRAAPTLQPAKRDALASLPPPFDGERLMERVRTLAAPGMQGRGYGSVEMNAARAYVIGQLKRAGVAPAGDAGGYEQCWSDDAGPGGKKVRACNVVATIPGSDKTKAAVVVGAHLDHLGRGWPEARKGNKGKVHPGADDNASGVAVLLEVARKLSEGGAGLREVRVVFFTGEEAGLRGSKRYLASLGESPKDKVLAMMNLDTVGRRGDGPFLVLGTESAREWVHVFMGIGFVTGVESRAAAEGLEASDHAAFLAAGIPAVHLFGGPHADYHAPTDTADKVSAASLVDAAVLTLEAVGYLRDRAEPLSATGAGGAGAKRPAQGGRKVSLGSVPDFAYRGPGVRLKGVTPGSPAEGGGMKAGDIIVSFGGQPVADLRGLAGFLRKAKAGEKVKVGIKRGTEELELEVTLMAR